MVLRSLHAVTRLHSVPGSVPRRAVVQARPLVHPAGRGKRTPRAGRGTRYGGVRGPPVRFVQGYPPPPPAGRWLRSAGDPRRASLNPRTGGASRRAACPVRRPARPVSPAARRASVGARQSAFARADALARSGVRSAATCAEDVSPSGPAVVWLLPAVGIRAVANDAAIGAPSGNAPKFETWFGTSRANPARGVSCAAPLSARKRKSATPRAALAPL